MVVHLPSNVIQPSLWVNPDNVSYSVIFRPARVGHLEMQPMTFVSPLHHRLFLPVGLVRSRTARLTMRSRDIRGARHLADKARVRRITGLGEL